MKQQQQPSAAAAEFRHEESRSRYEARMDGKVVGEVRYRMENGDLVFTHTEVDKAFEGQGLASRLAAHALDDVRRRGLKAVLECEFIAGYIARHEKEYGDLVRR